MDELKIITFYSYKGGVGRSMALANLAWLLANRYKQRVLMVDWDLDAPGLHKFFQIPDDKFERGLIDIFYDYKTLMQKELSNVNKEFLKVKKYILGLTERNDGGSLSILPAGRLDSKYAKRVNDFDWDDFYNKWRGHGFVEYLRKQFLLYADIVLIDSRTGITDIGGICTLQMPDTVVLMFTFNEQNISGTEKIAESIRTKAKKFRGNRLEPEMILIPSRIERYLEQYIREEWENEAAKRLVEYIPEGMQSGFLDDVQRNSIPYIGLYAFGERLAVENQPNKELATSYAILLFKIFKELEPADGVFPKYATPERHSFTSYISRLFLNIIMGTVMFAILVFISQSIDWLSDKLKLSPTIEIITRIFSTLILSVGVISIVYFLFVALRKFIKSIMNIRNDKL